MKILLLGATGRTGKLSLEYALHKGHQVYCLARNTDRIPKHPNLTLFEGNPSDPDDLKRALANCEAVIGVLNISRTSDFPWAKLRTPKTFLSNVMHQLLKLADMETLKRIIVCSAWGVAETKSDIPKWFKWFIENSNIGVAYQDHEAQEDILTKSKIDWTIVRPVGLTNAKRKESMLESYNNLPKPNLLISRQSVANFLIDCLDREDLIGKKVVISKA